MKSQIRKEIERILQTKFNHCYIDATTRHKDHYRMKLVTGNKELLTPSRKRKIMQLPGVYEVSYFDRNVYYPGVVIYFNYAPSTIKLKTK